MSRAYRVLWFAYREHAFLPVFIRLGSRDLGEPGHRLYYPCQCQCRWSSEMIYQRVLQCHFSVGHIVPCPWCPFPCVTPSNRFHGIAHGRRVFTGLATEDTHLEVETLRRRSPLEIQDDPLVRWLGKVFRLLWSFFQIQYQSFSKWMGDSLAAVLQVLLLGVEEETIDEAEYAQHRS